jgi:hypothetical protein
LLFFSRNSLWTQVLSELIQIAQSEVVKMAHFAVVAKTKKGKV